MNIDKSFKANYRCEVLEELPTKNAGKFYFPEDSIHGSDGIIVDVFPEKADEWLGIFAFGKISPNGTTGLYTCPNGSFLCVVAKGEGYIVNVNNMNDYRKIPIVPILGVTPVPAKKLLLFYDFVRIIALGREGIAWKSSQLSSDGLKIECITEESVLGYGWDAPTQKEISFEVQLNTGQIVNR